VTVLVCGGRDYDDVKAVLRVLNAIHRETPISLLVTGGASGADRHAETWAHLAGVRVAVYPADWKAHGRAAGPIRNAQMLALEAPRLVVAFPGGRGTADMVRKATDAGVSVQIVGGAA
jgi:hypothetical protein